MARAGLTRNLTWLDVITFCVVIVGLVMTTTAWTVGINYDDTSVNNPFTFVQSDDVQDMSNRTISTVEQTWLPVPHARIRINSDSDFNSQFPGRIISGFEINGSGGGDCIYIGNCTQKFSIENCTVHDGVGWWRSGDYNWNSGIHLFNCENATIIRNTVQRNDYGIFVHRSPGSRINGNIASMNGYYGICIFYDSNGTRVEGNDASRNDNTGIYQTRSDNTLIANNTAHFCMLYGLSFTDSNDCIVVNNTAASLNSYGTLLYRCGVFTVINNTFGSTNGSGLCLSTSSNNLVQENTAIGCGQYGIWLNVYSNDNEVSNNIVKTSNGSGILLSNSLDNYIHNNSVCRNNGTGIRLDLSGNNRIYCNVVSDNTNYGLYADNGGSGNLFILNNISGNNGATSTRDIAHVQAADFSGGNRWDIEGVPIGRGNYWSDWTSPDSNSDGIVDISYLLDGGKGVADNHPIAGPIAITESMIFVFIVTPIVAGVSGAGAIFRRARKPQS